MQEKEAYKTEPSGDYVDSSISWITGGHAVYVNHTYNSETQEYTFSFSPTKDLIWREQVQDWEFDAERDVVVKTYPKDLVIDNSSGLSHQFVILADLKGNRQLIDRKMDNERRVVRALKEENNMLRMQVHSLRTNLAEAALFPDYYREKVLLQHEDFKKRLDEESEDE